jgi:tetratricopeptide (TPR) repeat protein
MGGSRGAVKQEAAVAGAFLREQPRRSVTDAEILRREANEAAARGLLDHALLLLRRAVEREPEFVQGFVDLTSLLCRVGQAEQAAGLLKRVLVERPQTPWALSLKAAVLEAGYRSDEALGVHEELLSLAPRASVPWMNYGHTLKAVGRLADAVTAYRRSLELDPANGFAWWGLANLRTVQLGAEDVALMERVLPHATDDLSRIQLQFALGKALGDLGRFEPSFRHYEHANAIRGKLVPYDAEAVGDLVRRAATTFTPEFLAQRLGQGCDAPGPIFIVGMPRSGSTLVEQILASHPMIEGAGELPALKDVAASIAGPEASKAGWLEAVSRLGAGELEALGKSYLAGTRRFRRTDRPFFTDKLPANWQHVGLIQLILPNARIVDVRRQPLACCFSAFTTYFNRETRAPANLDDWARYYRDYVGMMDLFEAAVPGRIHRLRYEPLVDDLEGEVRRLLSHLGLPFDEACLRFHENSRAVHTPSAQQVREPINRNGLHRWRHYEPWLEPLKSELGVLANCGDPSSEVAHPNLFSTEIQPAVLGRPPSQDASSLKGIS